ncbi:MAG TPA: protein kinase, partial [Polyangiaceae bacterium]|nr:protein kinase [Polyangiaceae bacterium]
VVGPGQVVAGRYRIERWLGQGGMGSVYRALQLSVRRTVALKMLVDEHLENQAHVERFEREALALSRLSHQSTVRLFDFGADERGCPFIVMEYLDGHDLAVDLERHGPMRWDHALEVSVRLLGSLAEAHAAGIIHRDIKPANVFLCSSREWPVVKVLDFGIAGGAEPRADARKLTLTGTVLGSAPYMSPEQAQGIVAGPAADLYSFGVVLFEMLTGRTPFEARTLTAQLLAKVLEVAPRLGDVCPALDAPAELHALVAALLERDPARRPPSARATAERIEALLARAALPPLSRAEQRPHASAALPGVIAKTEPMRVPHTIDEGWAPPRTEAPARSVRGRRGLGWGAVLATLGVGAAASLLHASSRSPEMAETAEPAAALAALHAQPPSLDDPSGSERAKIPLDAGIDAPFVADAGPPRDEARPQPLASVATPAPRSPLPTRSRREATARPRTIAVSATRVKTPDAPRQRAEPRPSTGDRLPPDAMVMPAPESAAPRAPAPASTTPAATTPNPSSTASTTPAATTPEPIPSAPTPPDPIAPASSAPTTPDPSAPASITPDPTTPEPITPEPTAAPPRWGAPILDPRYWTVAAARIAARRGEITPAERNEIIAALRERRLRSRARAARAYREGRIGVEEFRDRQRAIERRFEGW